MGANSGTITIANPTLVGTQTTQNLYNTTATTVNAFGSATTANIGANSGTLTVGNPTLVGTQTTQNLYNTTATTVNAFGDATAINIGNIDGTATINNSLTAIVGNITIGGGNIATSASTGAVVVTGGVGISSNVWVAQGAVFNSTNTSQNFQVNGVNTTSLILADSNRGGIVFGGSATSIPNGAVAKFNNTNSIILPVGDISQRPSNSGNVDLTGMARFSTSANNLEFFDGTAWQVAGSTFTIITTNLFTGDGVETEFTLSTPSTTAGTLVNIQGVMQIPSLAYSVDTYTLTFTEPPALGEIIDARVIITTSTVSSLANGSGYVEYKAADNYANISAGTSSTTVRLSIAASDGTATFTNNVKIQGNITGTTTFTDDVIIQGNLTVNGTANGVINIGNSSNDNVVFNADVNSGIIPNIDNTYNLGSSDQGWATLYVNNIVASGANTAVGGSAVVIDSFEKATYRTAKYILSVSNSGTGEYDTSEVLVTHNGTTAYRTQYASVYTGAASLGTVSVAVNGANVELSYTGVAGGNTVKLQSTYIEV